MSPKFACLDCGKVSSRSRCEMCMAIKQQNNPRFRAKTAARGYGSQWQNKVRLSILNRDGWKCNYCGKHLEGSDATVDHVIPLARGGDKLDPNNLVASCRSCNSSKKDK